MSFNVANITKDWVTLWRADSTLTEIPLFPPNRVAAGNAVQYATVECRPGRKQRNSGRRYLIDYVVVVRVYATDRLVELQATAQAMADKFDFIDYAWPTVQGVVLTCIDLPDAVVRVEEQKQQAKTVRSVTRAWKLRLQETRGA